MIVYSVAEEYTAVAVQSFKDAVVHLFFIIQLRILFVVMPQ